MHAVTLSYSYTHKAYAGMKQNEKDFNKGLRRMPSQLCHPT